MHSIGVPSDAEQTIVSALASDADVVRVERDHSRDTATTPNDPRYADQWSLPRIGWDVARDSVTPTGSATVALLDTGVDASHPDLAGVVVPGANVLTGSGDGETDPNGHGTEMAGIVAAATNNGEGIAGVGYAGVKVMPITVLNDQGLGLDSDVISGVVYAVQHNADVILMSFSNPGYSASLQSAIDWAWSQNVVIVAATGNDASTTLTYPAGDRGVVGVSSTGLADTVSGFSNTGADVFIAAPGEVILTTLAGGTYGNVSGTSAAAAEVAGAAALLKATTPGVSNGVVVNRLAETADAVGTVEQTGNGRLSLDRALTDASMSSIEPAGADPVGAGGPFVGPYTAAGNAGTVSGTMTLSSGSPTTATVTCSNTGTNPCVGLVTATPAANGTYSFSNTNAPSNQIAFSGSKATVRLTASAPGCTSTTQDVVIPSNNANVSGVNFSLTCTSTSTHLAFGQQPTNSAAGASITPAVTVRVLDASDNLVSSSTASITVAIGNNAGPGGTLGGTTTVSAAGGIATFSNLSIDKTGTAYTLTASSTGLTGATSNAFNITPAAATHLAFGEQPTNTTAGQSISPAVTMRVLDANDNLVTSDNATKVTLSIGTNPGGGTLTGGGQTTVSGGVATFSALSIDKTGTSYTLVATDTAGGGAPHPYTQATSTSFNITTRTTSTSVSCSPSPVDAGATTTCTATVLDTNGAGSSTSTGTVTFSTDGSGTFGNPGATCSLSGGQCTIGYTPSASAPAGTHHIGATYGGDAAHAGSVATAFALGVTVHADLSITKSDAVSSVVAGTSTTYTITVRNGGPSTEPAGVVVKDTAPAGTTPSESEADCVLASGVLTCTTAAALAPGASVSYQLTLAVAPGHATGSGALVNTAKIDSTPVTDPDVTAASNQATDTDDVTAEADLSITKSDAVTTVIAGSGLTYTFTITVTNAGPSNAQSVAVYDIWPSGYAPSTLPANCSNILAGPSFTCNLGTVANGGTAAVMVSYTVPASTTTSQTNTVTVSSAATDANTANNAAYDMNSVNPNHAPTVFITSPTFGSTYARGSAQISPLTLNATFTDPDVGQNWTWTINWDDNGTTTGTVSSVQPKTITGTHSFTSAGVYTITVTACDSGDPSLCGAASVWIIVYDSNAGFVTGGGWIDVGAGSYTANLALAGRANFGFNSQYKKGASVPTGQTEFNFQVGNLNFHSENYTWLVVSGYKAQYKGTGTINGSGNYGFTLTAYDGDITGGGGVDKFRIQITDGNHGNAVVFDNGDGSTDIDTANPEAISGGSIVIHKA